MWRSVAGWPRRAGRWLVRPIAWILGSLNRVAVVLVVLAAFAALLWGLLDSRWIDGLAPNVMTESLGIALALTVIDRLIRRRDRERVEPLVDYALETIDMGVRLAAGGVAINYVMTHRDRKELPEDALSVVEFWLDNEPLVDAPLGAPTDGKWPLPLADIFELAETAFHQTDPNRHDFITAGLVEIVMASKDLATGAKLLQAVISARSVRNELLDGELSDEEWIAQRDEALRGLVRQGVTTLAEFLRVYEPQRQGTGRPALTVPEYVLEGAHYYAPPP